MSEFREKLGSGEVKILVGCFVDMFEDMFNCSICDVALGVVDCDDSEIRLILKKEI